MAVSKRTLPSSAADLPVPLETFNRVIPPKRRWND